MIHKVPSNIKIYHIIHIANLKAIITDNNLYSDAEIRKSTYQGTSIGMQKIKDRRLKYNLNTYEDLSVGECVPFYFCPRSVMLFLLHKGNHDEISYTEGQKPIIHLEADFNQVIDWAKKNSIRWVFTDSNAGSAYFNDYADIAKLKELDWTAITQRNWQDVREKKQAEFLIDTYFPLSLISRIGVYSNNIKERVEQSFEKNCLNPEIKIRKDWYY